MFSLFNASNKYSHLPCYDKMSILLGGIVNQRKDDAIAYE